jgi:hypothetical protein
MPSKTTKKGNTKSDTGVIGVLFEGLLAKKASKLFWCESSDEKDIQEMFEEEVKRYGKSLRGQYIQCEDAEKVFASVSKLYKEVNDIESLYSANHGTMFDSIKQESGLNKPQVLTLGEPKTKAKPKLKKDNEENNDSDDEKETSKKTKKTNKKVVNDKSDDEDEDDDEDEEVTTKKTSSTKNEKEDSDDDEDNEEDDEEDKQPKNSKSKVTKSRKDKESPKKNTRSKGK